MNISRLGPALLAACWGHATAQSNTAEVTTPATVVTAARFPESAAEGAVNVTVIDAAQIARSGATNVPDLLVQEAGIHTRDLYGNNAAGAAVDLRGFGATAGQNTLILVDGRRLNDIDLSGVQWSSVPLSAIERIEIVRGSGAVQYGDGASNGVINIITRSPAAAQRGMRASARAGTFDTRELAAGGNVAGDSGGIALGGSYYQSDGYRENNRNETGNAYLDARWMQQQTTVSFKAGADTEDLRLPGARTVQPSAGIDQLATDRRGTSTPLDFATRDGRRAAFEVEHQAPGFDLTVGLGYRDKEQTSYFDFSGFPDYREVDLDVWSFTPRVRVPLAEGARATLVAGFDWYTWDYALRISNAQANIGQPINRVSADQENRAAYLRVTAQLTPTTSATAGWRYEEQRIDAQDAFDPSAPGAAFGSGALAGSQTVDEPAWELSLRQALSPALALSARAGRGFRFATVDEIYETSALGARQFQFLRPQTSEGHDLGAEYASRAWFARATVFQLDVDDEIHLDPYSAGVGNTNLPPSRRRGLELEAHWRPGQSLSVQAAYTYTEARFREGTLPGSAFTQQNVDIAGKTVPLVPEHQASARVIWQMAPAWRLSGSARHVSSQFMENDEGNTLGVKIPAYSLVDLRLDFLHGPLTMTAAVDNLFDEQYYNYAVRSQFVPDRYNAYPLPERTFWVSVQVRLP